MDMSTSWCIGDVKLLSEDMIYDILLWLPVLSLLRFKSVCKSWRALINSCHFIKQHLHHHHYNHQASLKDRKLIFPLPSGSVDPHPNTFLLTSVDNFEVPPTKLELEIPAMGYQDYALVIGSIATFDGIICMNYRDVNSADGDCTPTKYITSLFNPATKESRVLPKSSVIPIAPPNCVYFTAGFNMFVSIGFGFDVKTSDYKVARLFTFDCKGHSENRVEVYTLSSDSWRIIDVVVPVDRVMFSTFRPFKNGTCYCWWGKDLTLEFERSGPVIDLILCFDFSTEVLRTINIPDAVNGNDNNEMKQLAIINDNIACISCDGLSHLEIWMLKEYGNSVNESWAMHFKVVDFFQIKSLRFTPFLLLFSMDGKYIFYEGWNELYEREFVCKYDLVIKATEKHHLRHFFENVKDHPSFFLLPRGYDLQLVAEFKESLVPIRGGNC